MTQLKDEELVEVVEVEDAVKVGEVGSRRVLEGLMGQNVGLKSFILDRTDIESFWFKELGEFFCRCCDRIKQRFQVCYKVTKLQSYASASTDKYITHDLIFRVLIK